MDTGQLVLIIVIAVVVIAVVVIALTVGRRKKAEANRQRAEVLREKAAEEAIGAHQAKAESAQAEADALQAEVEANRLRKEAERHASKADEAHNRVEEHLRHADKLDPNAGKNGHADATRADAPHADSDASPVPRHSGSNAAGDGHVAEGERLTRDRSDRGERTADGTQDRA